MSPEVCEGPKGPKAQANKTKERSPKKDRPFLHYRVKFLPWTNLTGNKLSVEKSVRTRFLALPNLRVAPLGTRLRYLRKRRGLTLMELARRTGVSHGAICRLENGMVPLDPARLGRILAFFGDDAREVLPDGADIYDHVIPVKDFGSWLRNFRMRRGIPQKNLAEALGVHKVTVCRYEKHGLKPDARILKRLRRQFNLGAGEPQPNPHNCYNRK
ncbi:MAG: helix-turn-helix transcriptional regulator [Elusimicrobiota bacterium]